MKPGIYLTLFYLAFVPFITRSQPHVLTVNLPEAPGLNLEEYAIIPPEVATEVSGIVKSRYYEDVFWILNDSGDEPRIIPINREGEVVGSYRSSEIIGQYIREASNSDWEDITIDNQGFIYICDVGNNCNCRKDLVLYKIIETDPGKRMNKVFQKIFFRYPDQKEYPASEKDFNFDSEGVFVANGKLYILSKNRSNTHTTLYRLDETHPFEVNTLTALQTFDIKGQVTAADASPDGKQIAVLTYTGVWVFEASEEDRYFEGKIWWQPINNTFVDGRPQQQVESICYDDAETLIIADELGGRLYEIKLNQLISIR